MIHDRDINAAKNVENIGRDTAEFKPVEKLTTALSKKTTKQVGSMKQESLASQDARYFNAERMSQGIYSVYNSGTLRVLLSP